MSSQRRVIVVGAGLFGLAGAWALSRRGWQVDVLEAGPAPGHEWSGSKGEARIFRLGYPEAHYVDMARRGAALWLVLESATGRHLLHRTGQASLGDPDVLEAVAGALETAGAPAAWLSPAQARDRFPLLATDCPVLFEPESGVLAADECLRALCEDGDFELHTRTRVTEVLEHAGSVAVATDDRRGLEADVVVLCAGPHSLGLLGHPGAASSGTGGSPWATRWSPSGVPGVWWDTL